MTINTQKRDKNKRYQLAGLVCFDIPRIMAMR